MLYPLSVIYNSEFKCIEMKLYNTKTERLESYFDADFLAYCLSKQKLQIPAIRQTMVELYNALSDSMVKLWKVEVENPKIISKTHDMEFIWENHIKFFQSFIYNTNISLGMPHEREANMLVFQIDYEAEKRVKELVKLVNPPESDIKITEDLARLLEYPAPRLRRASLDIEVLNDETEAIPNPEVANLPIICACLMTSDGQKIAFVLIRPNKKTEMTADATRVSFFTDETELIDAIFSTMDEYPVIATFNGDDFDLRYIMNRARKLGILEDKIPIYVEKKFTMLKNAIHIDLYRFFSIRAMMIYAFAEKYKNVDLDTVAKALIGEGKLKNGKKLNDLTYSELVTYCMRDADITFRLTSYNNDLVMKLIFALSRLSQTPLENVTRKSISNWIRNMIFREHRKRNILIPNPEDIVNIKGTLASAATIKGKKYRGAVVVTPKAGFHFKTKVGDFASLYPSIIKVHNLGYATVNCSHEECKSNTVGELPHWICKKNRAIESQLIGALRDLRVTWYKKKAKDKEIEQERKEWYSVAEQSIKVICNASYGVFGSEDFVLYCPPFAEEVTAIGRHDISETISHAQANNMQVLYGDTDSIFLKDPPKEKLDELIKWAKERFGVEFEIEKNYRYVCLSGRKKNYLGVFEDGKVDVKGLTGKKKHTPKIFRDTFDNIKSLLAKIYTEEDAINIRKEIAKIIKELYYNLKKREIDDLNLLAFNVTINKDLMDYGKEVEYIDKEGQKRKKRTEKGVPQHIRAARQLKASGYLIQIGSTVSFVKVTGKQNVKPVGLAKKEDLDVSKYIEFMQSTFVQILEPLGIDWDKDILGVCSMDQWTNGKK